MKQRLIAICIAVACSATSVYAQDETFDIVRFEVNGNTLLPDRQVKALVAPFVGRGKVYGDIQRALEALEGAYRKLGFSTVNVHVPEQEITSGVVRLDVAEAALGRIRISGNKHFDTENIRASLPNLKVGEPPNLRKISENVQLINENPAKQVEVTLGVSDEPGKVDARVRLTEENPQRFILTLDNSGTMATGRHRFGAAYQHANVLGNDEMLTLAYTTSPDLWIDYPPGVKLDVYSVAFRKPFYALGDSLDVIYGNSNLNVPSSTSALGSPFAINGKGEVLAVRWNHLFPRRGEYTARLIFGFDVKHINATCTPDQRGTTSTCTPYTLRPLSATYSGQRQGATSQWNYNFGLNWNAFPTGVRYNHAASAKTDRYSFVTGRPVSDNFMIWRYGGSYARLVDGWQLRAAFSGQYAHSAVPAPEQFGLTGSTTVRGFDERAVAADTGYVANLEAYTPNLADQLGVPGTLNGVFFYDMGHGRNIGAAGTPFNRTGVASFGAGVRYTLDKQFSLSLDMADILDLGPSDLDRRNGWGGHFKMMLAF